MKVLLRGASSAAMLIGLAAIPAFGQESQTVETAQSPQPASPNTQVETTEPQAATGAQDRVVVTGSLIAGASEDAPLAVDVFNIEELKDRGSPNIQEFARSLSQSGETTGETSVVGGAGAAGTSNVSLRGLGPARTLTLLNGRRTTENTNAIPTAALQRVEVLKEGAGVTYGAGAVAGVVNFVTRRDVDGLEVSLEKKFYEGSEGEIEINALTGWVGDTSNFLFSITYADQDSLKYTKRPDLLKPYEELPIQYTGDSPNPGTYFIPGSTTAVRDFNQASCNELGGFSRIDTECFYRFAPFYDFVNEETTYRTYSEFNADLSDDMEFHAELTYSKVNAPNVSFSPAGNPVASHRAVAGSATGLNTTARSFQIPIVNDDWNGAVTTGGVRNPFIDRFYNDLRARGQFAGATNPTSGSVYTGSLWRVFGQGGNPSFDYGGRRQRVTRDFFQTAGALKGEFERDTWFGLLAGIKYNHSLSFDQSTSEVFLPDQITENVQNALRGYGGPNCKAVDRITTDYSSVAAFDRTVGIQDPLIAPGTNGCLWFNPFASAYASNPFTGASFSGFGGPGFANPKELTDWLHADRGTETQTQNLTFDSVYSGTIPAFELPGGEIGWAAGVQWRSEESRTRVVGPDALRELSRRPCVWGDQVVGDRIAGTTIDICTGDKPGVWVENADQIDTDQYSDRHSWSAYAEAQIPVLDNLNFQLGWRRENYGGLEGDVYKVAGKWDILDWLAVRGSWSTNFTAPPLGLRPGIPQSGVTFNLTFLNAFPTTNIDAPGIVPEEATNTGLGLVLAPSFGENNFRFSADYFNIEDENQIVTTSLTTILQGVLPSGNNVNTALVNCSSPLMVFITLAGTCQQGTTVGTSITDILLTRLNGPGQNTSGIDYQFMYDRPFLDGTLSAGFTATQLFSYERLGYSVAGVQIETTAELIGLLNNPDTPNTEFAARWRGNAFAALSLGEHNFRLQANYISGVRDELGCSIVRAPGSTTGPRTACYGVFPEDYVDYDFHWRYQPEFVEDLEVRLSVLNLTEEDPVGSQRQRDAYNTAITPSGARGRQLEIGVSKKF